MNKPSSKNRDNPKTKEKEKSKPKAKDDKNPKKKNHLYKIERVCGNGSFGIVFQGKILHTGETIAIKKVYQDRRFRNREFSIMSLLDHPNIVKVRHAFYTTGEKLDEIYLNLVMNYVPENLNRLNKSLFEKKEMLPVFLIKLYCFQIARALNYIHNKKICHRDIKPQNILLDPQTNRIYICDFGSAKMLKREDKLIEFIFVILAVRKCLKEKNRMFLIFVPGFIEHLNYFWEMNIIPLRLIFGALDVFWLNYSKESLYLEQKIKMNKLIKLWNVLEDLRKKILLLLLKEKLLMN